MYLPNLPSARPSLEHQKLIYILSQGTTISGTLDRNFDNTWLCSNCKGSVPYNTAFVEKQDIERP